MRFRPIILGLLATLSLLAPAWGVTRYLDPVNGSASGDGTTLATAWLNPSQANTALAAGGVDTLLIVPASGDAFSLDAPLFVPSNVKIDSATQGVPFTLDWSLSLSAATWTSEGSGVYSTLLSTANNRHLYAAVFETSSGTFPFSPLWYELKAGATWAAVTAAVQGQAGSYWLDDALGKLYVHTISGASPAGQPLRRTVNYADLVGAYNRPSGIVFGTASTNAAAANVSLSNCQLCGVGLVDPVTGSVGSVGMWCIGGGLGGTSVLSNIYTSGGSNHAMGWVYHGAGANVRIDDARCEQMLPGSAGSIVDAPLGTTDRTGIVVVYNRPRVDKGQAVYRSTAGATISTIDSNTIVGGFGSHFTSGTTPYVAMIVNDPRLSGGSIGANDPVATTLLFCGNIKTSSAMAGFFGSNSAMTSGVSVQGINFNWACVRSFNATDVIACRSCIFVPNSGASTRIAGQYLLEGCGVDMHAGYMGDGVFASAGLNTSKMLQLTCHKNWWAQDQNGKWLFNRIRGDEIVAWDDNQYVYDLASTNGPVIKNFNPSSDGSTVVDATLDSGSTAPSMKAYGLDLTSGFLAAAFSGLKVDGNYFPTGGSPLLVSSPDIGPAIDATGRTLGHRTTRGIWQSPILIPPPPIGPGLQVGAGLN